MGSLTGGPDAVVLADTVSQTDVDLAVEAGADVLLHHTVGNADRLPSGAAGLVVDADTSRDMHDAIGRLAATEAYLGAGHPFFELLPVISSPLGVWRAREIARFSRVRQVGFCEDAFIRAIGGAVDGGVDPCFYARGRVVTEALVAGAQPVCRAERLSSSMLFNAGYRGFLIDDPVLIDLTNDVLTPSAEDVAYAEQVRDAFMEGVAGGTAAVRLGQRMIDVPVYKAALGVLEWADACAARESTKRVPRQNHSM
ncbi:hypothetical protein [Blastococcus sp. URHD0036]|uniref:hypothetical protein n=1 Tax=Blastococcus sp. URHD0036 TaxID=1380356 RepID=UPI0012DE0F20|nr:hypothetical protein [Blastococcus sp. URHD0036]